MSSREKIELHNTYDMLKGSINRMFVTDDNEEFEREYKYSQAMLNMIYYGLKETKGCQNI